MAMRSTITSRGQTVIPVAIRERFALGPFQRLEWLVETDGSIRVIPVAASPVKACRGKGVVSGQAPNPVREAEAAAARDVKGAEGRHL